MRQVLYTYFHHKSYLSTLYIEKHSNRIESKVSTRNGIYGSLVAKRTTCLFLSLKFNARRFASYSYIFVPFHIFLTTLRACVCECVYVCVRSCTDFDVHIYTYVRVYNNYTQYLAWPFRRRSLIFALPRWIYRLSSLPVATRSRPSRRDSGETGRTRGLVSNVHVPSLKSDAGETKFHVRARFEKEERGKHRRLADRV